MALIQQVATFSLFPVVAMIVGGFVATFRAPGDKLTSITQHFAGGVVFAAVALELLPKISHAKEPISLTIGFLLGLGLMLAIKKIFGEDDDEENGGGESGAEKAPMSLIMAVAIDVFIDGLLIGIAFTVGERGGILINLALGIEIFFLGISLAATLMQKKISKIQSNMITVGLSFLIMAGALLGLVVMSHLPSNWVNGMLAFGVAALLYLVTEELLVEAHEVVETPLITSSFFIGFFLIFLIDTQIYR